MPRKPQVKKQIVMPMRKRNAPHLRNWLLKKQNGKMPRKLRVKKSFLRP